MSFSASKQAGLALVALLRGDRDLAGVRTAIAADDARAIARLLEARPDSRREQVASLLNAVRPQLAALPPGLPLRVSGLLAPRLPRAAGRAALDQAPAPRSDFVARPALLLRLLRIARRQATGEQAC